MWECCYYSLVSKLGTNVTDINVLQGLVGLQVANLHNEGMRTVVLATDIELSHDHSVVGSATEGTDPPLGGSECGGIDGEGLVIGVPGGGGLEAADIGSVTQFGLGVATDDLVFFGPLEEQLVLLGAALFAEGHLEREGVSTRAFRLSRL